MKLTFKKFFEEMNPTFDKKMDSKSSTRSGDYFQGLGDEMGIEWDDIVKSMQNEPWISSHFSLGNPYKPDDQIQHKLSAWEIVPGTFTPEGADIRLKVNKGDRSYLSGNKLNKTESDNKRYHLSREELVKFLTTGWSPAISQNQGGMGGDMMGGMPPTGGM